MMQPPRFGIGLLLSVTTGCASFHASRTPERVDLRPILDVELKADVERLEPIEGHVPKDATHRRESNYDFMGFSTPGRRKLEHVYRVINIQRYGSAEGAGNGYLDYRREFGDGSAWKLYEERGTGSNRCFSSYETPWTSTNHGIPVGVVAGPHILIVGQKRNLLVTISYSSYRNDVWDYAPDINDDIAYAVELLKRLSAASDSGAARGRL